MFKLPKSIVLEGRRYPTWVLSSGARAQLINLQQVDAHIAELREQLTHYLAVRALFKQRLRDTLTDVSNESVTPCFWHMVTREWAEECWLPSSARCSLSLHSMRASNSYQQGDTLIIYVKGLGVVGWGNITPKSHSTELCFTWQCRVETLGRALPAKSLYQFSLRHPTRLSQRLPENADISRLFSVLASQ